MILCDDGSDDANAASRARPLSCAVTRCGGSADEYPRLLARAAGSGRLGLSANDGENLRIIRRFSPKFGREPGHPPTLQLLALISDQLDRKQANLPP